MDIITQILTASAIIALFGLIFRWHHGMIQDRVTKRECQSCKESTTSELGHGGERFTRIDRTLESLQTVQNIQAETLSQVQQLLGRIEERVSYLARTNGYKDQP